MHRALRNRFCSALVAAISQSAPDRQAQLPTIIEAIAAGGSNNNDSSLETAIALGLYWHQDLPFLRQYCPTPNSLVLAYSIALCCRDALHPRAAIGDMRTYIEPLVSTENPDWQHASEQLRIVQDLVERGSSGAIARQVLDLPIAYSLYCFLFTPDNWRLASQRAQQAGMWAGIATRAITAAYLGKVPTDDAAAIALGDRVGNRLFAAWAGTWDGQYNDALAITSITAPDILQRRI